VAHAQRRGVVHRGGGAVFVGGYFYDPFFGPYPWWGPAAYPYPYYPVYDNRAEVRVLATPREAAVYVDGYYAGVVDDFDGVFQRLPLSPGAHEISLFLQGYRTARQRIYLSPGSTYKLRHTMERLAPGERSEAPAIAPPVPAPPPGTATRPRRLPPGAPRAGGPPPPPDAGAPPDTDGPPPDGAAPPFRPRRGPGGMRAAGYGTLAIRVQPRDADVLIDGERWNASDASERLTIELSEGRHRVEVHKNGYRPFSIEVDVRPGGMTPLNVSLSPEARQ
jgi:hypothetical protein